MSNNRIVFHAIGFVHSPHQRLSETPIQPVFCKGIKGSVHIYRQYSDALLHLEEFSHIYLLYCFHKVKKVRLIVKPYLEDKEHGLFATRAPCRPNPVGLSLVKLLSVKDNILYIEDVDILDGTPVLDIKPYIQRYDSRKRVRSGWQEHISNKAAKLGGKRNFRM